MKKENKTTKKIILILTVFVVLLEVPFKGKRRKNNIDSFISNLFNNNQLGVVNA